MENRARSVIKTVSWRVIAIVLTILFSYIWLQEWTASLEFALVLNLAKAIGYYLHERVWNVVHWGRG